MKKPEVFRLAYDDAEKIARMESMYGPFWRNCVVPDAVTTIVPASDDYHEAEKMACKLSLQIGDAVDIHELKELRGQTHHGIEVWDWNFEERVARINNGRVTCLFSGGDYYF